MIVRLGLQRGADRMRAAHDRLGTMVDLVHWLADETLLETGLGRRSTQRNGA